MNEPLSAMARMISSCRRSMRSAYMSRAHGSRVSMLLEERGNGCIERSASIRSSRFVPPGEPLPPSARRRRAAACLARGIPVHLDPDEVHPQLRARDGGEPRPMNGSATSGSARGRAAAGTFPGAWGEGRRVRPVLVAALDRFVRDEPGVAAASHPAGRGPPAADVRLILVFHADGLPIERRMRRRA